MGAGRGRPRKHKDESERFQDLRARMKAAGEKEVKVWLTGSQKEQLDNLRHGLNITQAEAISYLLECAFDRELPNLTHAENASDSTDEEAAVEPKVSNRAKRTDEQKTRLSEV